MIAAGIGMRHIEDLHPATNSHMMTIRNRPNSKSNRPLGVNLAMQLTGIAPLTATCSTASKPFLLDLCNDSESQATVSSVCRITTKTSVLPQIAHIDKDQISNMHLN